MLVISDFGLSVWKRRQFWLIAFLLVATIGISASIWVGTRSNLPGDEWTAAQLTRALKENQVSRLFVSGNRLVAETTSGSRALVRTATGASALGALEQLGIDKDLLRNITIVAEQPAGGYGLASWLRWLCSVPVVVLLLGVWGILFARRPLLRAS